MGLDVNNLPKYCPQCAKSDTQSKVKLFRMKDGTSMIMCKNAKCPWPFSEYSREAVTFACADKKKESVSKIIDVSTDVEESPKKSKRRRSGKVSPDFKNETTKKVKSNKKEASPSKQIKETKVFLNETIEISEQKTTPNIAASDATFKSKRKLSHDSSLDAQKKYKSINVAAAEPESIFSLGPEPATEEDPLDSLVSSSLTITSVQGSIAGPSNVTIPQPALTEAEIFKAVPVALRRPLRLPKHAVHILDSRVNHDDLLDEKEMATSGLESMFGEDQNDMSDDDLEGSDSELDDLVSNCSTMTQISGQSITNMDEGNGKVKRRGRKKKRKDRRKQHSQKCSKNGPRTTDIADIEIDDDDDDIADKDFVPDAYNDHDDSEEFDAVDNEDRVEMQLGEGDIEYVVDASHPNTTKVADENPDEDETMLFEEMVPVSNFGVVDTELVEDGDGEEDDTENNVSMISIESGVFDDVVTLQSKPIKRELVARSLTGDHGAESVQSIIYREADIVVYSVENNSNLKYIGEGDTCVGIKYEDPRTGRNVRCKPFCVPKQQLKNLVIIIQKHMEILRMKAYKKKIGDCLTSDTDVTRAKTKLDKVVVNYVKHVFTLKWLEEDRKNRELEGIDEVYTTGNISLDLPVSVHPSPELESQTNIPLFQDLHSESEEFTGAILEMVNPGAGKSEIKSTFKKPLAPSEDTSPQGKHVSPKFKKEFIRKVADSQKKELFFNMEMEPLSPMPPTPGSDDGSLPSPSKVRSRRDQEAGSILPDLDHPNYEEYSIVDESVVESIAAPQLHQTNDKASVQVKVENKKHLEALKNIQLKSMPSLSNRLVMKTGIKGISIKTVCLRIEPQAMNPDRYSPTDEERSSFMHNNPTMKLLDQDRNDAELSLAWKLVTGSASPPRIQENEKIEVNLADPLPAMAASSTTFHVAHQNTIDLPQRMHSTEITERGHNKVLLTANSDRVEVNSLKSPEQEKKNVKRRYIRKLEYGDGWFMWRKRKVDTALCTQFIEFFDDIKEKYDVMEPLKALGQERKINKCPDVFFAAQFYEIILSKVQHLMDDCNLTMEAAIDFIRPHLKKSLNEFYKLCEDVFKGDIIVPEDIILEDILSQETMRRLEHPTEPRGDVTQHLSRELINKMKRMKCVKTDKTDMPEDLTIKQEPSHDPYATFGTSVSIIDPASVQVMSEDEVIGDGDMCIQFFYEDPVTGSKVSFKPVYVRCEEDIKAVMALCSERAAEFKYKCGHIKRPVRYYSEVVRARTRLSPQIIKYITSCFTKQGMKYNRIDYKKKEMPRLQRYYEYDDEEPPKGKLGVKKERKFNTRCVQVLDTFPHSPDDGAQADSEEEFEEFDEEEAAPAMPPKMPKRRPKSKRPKPKPQDDSERVLEERVFGISLPKLKVDEKLFTKKRKDMFIARDGKAKDIANACITMQNVNQILDSRDGGNQDRQPNERLKLTSLIKSTRRRGKKVVLESSSSESDIDEFFLDDLYRNKESGKTRRSARFKGKLELFGENDEPVDEPDPMVEELSDEQPTEIIDDSPIVPPQQSYGAAMKTISKLNSPSQFRRVTFKDKEITRTGQPNSCKNRIPETATTSQQSTSRPASRSSSHLPASKVNNSAYSPVNSPVVIDRALSALSVRSSSQTSNRPESRSDGGESRPSSNLERPRSKMMSRTTSKKHFGGSINFIEDPEEDSPVLAPRRRQQDKQKSDSSRPSSQAEIENFEKAAMSDEKAPGKSDKDETVAKAGPVDLQKFDQIQIRKSKKKRVKKILDKQKRKAEKNEKKKLLGFGQKKEDVDLETDNKANKAVSIKKAQVTKEESDLVRALLIEAEMAVSNQNMSMQQHSSVSSLQVGSASKLEISSASSLQVGSSSSIVSEALSSEYQRGSSSKEIVNFEEYESIMQTETHTDIDDILNTL